MANGNCESSGNAARVMEMFRAGRSKADIARELGKTKEQVAKLLAVAIREKASG